MNRRHSFFLETIWNRSCKHPLRSSPAPRPSSGALSSRC